MFRSKIKIGTYKMKLLQTLLASLLFLLSSAVLSADFSLPKNQWRIISLPANPPENSNTVDKVFGDDISGDYGADWALFEYDTGDNKYKQLTEFDAVKQGKGYWIIQLKEDNATLKMPAGSTDLSSLSINLASPNNPGAQWNLIGFPYSKPKALGDFKVKGSDICTNSCDLNESQQEQLVYNKVWTYNGNSYDKKGVEDNLSVWEGFWIPTLPKANGRNLSLVSTLADNHVDSISASDDGVTLSLQMKGTFIENSHFSFFIDADNNPNTGYTGAITQRQGADYLAQNHLLFQYQENAQNSPWVKVSDDIHLESTSTQALAHIPLQLLNAGNSIKYNAMVTTSDWSHYSYYSYMSAYQIGKADSIKTPIFIIGDSTVHNNDFPNPNGGFYELGWGDVLNGYMSDPQKAFNRARSGASSKSYKVDLGWGYDWGKTKNLIANTDVSGGAYLLIQFGHNDEHSGSEQLYTVPGRGNSFYTELKKYIDEAKDMGVIPVLITPVQRQLKGSHTHILRNPDGTYGNYPQTIRDLAADENIELLDLSARSFDEFDKYESTAAIHEKFGYDDNDYTHFNPAGARIIAGWVKDLACESNANKLCTQFK
jgi:lysophospholipase L1-like esterase